VRGYGPPISSTRQKESATCAIGRSKHELRGPDNIPASIFVVAEASRAVRWACFHLPAGLARARRGRHSGGARFRLRALCRAAPRVGPGAHSRRDPVAEGQTANGRCDRRAWWARYGPYALTDLGIGYGIPFSGLLGRQDEATSGCNRG
jgi:hypothetical protein